MCQRNFIQLPDGVHFSPSCLCCAPLYGAGEFMRRDVSGQKLQWYFILRLSKHRLDKDFCVCVCGGVCVGVFTVYTTVPRCEENQPQYEDY